MAIQDLLTQSGAQLYKLPTVNYRPQDIAANPSLAQPQYGVYIPGSGGQPAILHGVDSSILQSSGIDTSAIQDQQALSDSLGLSTPNGAFYGMMGGQNYTNVNDLNNQLSSYIQSGATKTAENASIAQSNVALGANAYQGPNSAQQQNALANAPAGVMPQTSPQISAGGATVTAPQPTTADHSNISALYSSTVPGQTSSQVTQLQQALIQAGFSIPAGATGYYGPQTQAAVAQWKATLVNNPPTAPNLTSPNASTIPTTGSQNPTLPTSGNSNATYISGIAQTLQTAQTTLDNARATQQQQITEAKNTAQANFDTASANENAAVSAEQTAKLDQIKLEEQRFNDNYNTVQGLIGKLSDLQTKGNALLSSQMGQTGLAAIMSPRIAQTAQDITAAAGVIQASITAYSNQMTAARDQLTTATSAITSAYQDQISYYSSLASFYSGQVTTATKDQTDFTNATVAMLQAKVEQAQANADNIKRLMTDPTTALFMAQAGITLNDTPDQVASKMAAQAKVQQVADFTNTQTTAGYTPVASAMAGTQGVVSYNVAGQTLYFKQPLKLTNTPSTDVVRDQYGNTISSPAGSTNNILTTPSGNNYDMATYATDPNHTAKVQSIISSIGKLSTPQDITNYINSVNPNSPVTAQMIEDASKTYGVGWEELLGLMQEESGLGTAGAAVSTKNPGNVGNIDGGSTTTYSSWAAGVNAAANALAQRKTTVSTTATLTPTQKTSANTLSGKLTALPSYKAYSSAIEQYPTVQSIPGNTTNPVQQKQLLLAIAQMFVPNATSVRGVIGSLEDSGMNSGLFNLINSAQKQLDSVGSLQPSVVQSLKDAATTSYNSTVSAFKSEANSQINDWGQINGVNNPAQYFGGVLGTSGASSSSSPQQGSSSPLLGGTNPLGI